MSAIVGCPHHAFADVDESTKKDIKDTFMAYDRTLLAADPRHRESKKFGGPGARAKYQVRAHDITTAAAWGAPPTSVEGGRTAGARDGAAIGWLHGSIRQVASSHNSPTLAVSCACCPLVPPAEVLPLSVPAHGGSATLAAVAPAAVPVAWLLCCASGYAWRLAA